MSDPKPRPPTAAEVVGRLKDDGDFDALRRAFVRKDKDNVSPQILYPKVLRFCCLFLVTDPALWNFDAYSPFGVLLIAVT
jgi:hypothetical protein